MTTNKKDYINKKFEEIDEKLKDLSLTEEQRQILLEERADYEETSQQLDEDSENKFKECNDHEESEQNSIYEFESECETTIEYESLYFKYCFDHCKNINDIIETLESLKEYFEQLKKEGHELKQPVDTGYCFIDKVTENENEQ